MTKFGVSFLVDSKHLGDIMETLHPFRVQELDVKLVAGTSKKVRAGDKPAWQIVAELADATPRQLKFFREKMLAAGFRNGTVYTAMARAVENKLLIKTAKGYKKGGAK